MKNLNRKTKHFLIDLLVSIVILSIAIFLSLNGNLDYANGRIYDLLFNIYRDNTEHCDNVIIACIDQKSIDYFEKNAGFGWPWPRSFYSFLVKYLTNCKARAIVFDVLFTEPDMNREEDNDSEFAAAIKESGIVYLSAAAQKTPITESSKNRIISDNQNHLFQHLKQTPLYNSVLYPLEEFSINARNIGLVNLAPDVDSINRKYPLVHQIGDSFCPSLAYAVVQGILTRPCSNARD